MGEKGGRGGEMIGEEKEREAGRTESGGGKSTRRALRLDLIKTFPLIQ